LWKVHESIIVPVLYGYLIQHAFSRCKFDAKAVLNLCIGITFESIQFPDTFIDWDTPLAYPIYRLISVAKLGVYRKRFVPPCLFVSPHSLSIWRLPLRHIRDITIRTTEKIYDVRSKDNLAPSIEKSMFDRTF
ncbi:hypothetical protein V1478_007217, partial [Vespula squamosa]